MGSKHRNTGRSQELNPFLIHPPAPLRFTRLICPFCWFRTENRRSRTLACCGTRRGRRARCPTLCSWDPSTWTCCRYSLDVHLERRTPGLRWTALVTALVLQTPLLTLIPQQLNSAFVDQPSTRVEPTRVGKARPPVFPITPPSFSFRFPRMFGLKASPLRDSILASSRIYSALHRNLFGLGEGAESPRRGEENHGASPACTPSPQGAWSCVRFDVHGNGVAVGWRRELDEYESVPYWGYAAPGMTYIRSPCCLYLYGKQRGQTPRPDG